ncbi:hypothetical protein BDV95DRAFT_577167 [Massariosphaeria phaeospora]|uniref:Uncharacterized protein n=1 Tax=Massariosphaeria phaeospora TaxID=100035 RepID=A0A7C8M3Q5_9PLEO|nr:hypothetical protein BDV95DRAFT_577167 [Massariosphaeria phaeospora]
MESNIYSPYSLYDQLLQQIPPMYTQWAQKVLSWVLRAFRPLTVAELAIAVALDHDPDVALASISALERQVPQDLEFDLERVFNGLIQVRMEMYSLCTSLSENISLWSTQHLVRRAVYATLSITSM